jgi:NAD(P)-dependent dehydrogenase (short-subunit alcohol dehydrogenase family)
MAVELGSLIRVIELQPAAVSTSMLEAGFASSPDLRKRLDEYHPTGRIGSPEEIAEVVGSLIETDAHFLNGAFVNMDGGISVRLHDPY